MTKFRTRASAAGQIMTENKVKSPAEKLAALQEKHYKLKIKIDATENKTTKTYKANTIRLDKYALEIADLNQIKNRAHLSKSAENYLKQWYIEDKYDRRKDIGSKYTEKGNQVEDDSITLYTLVEKKGMIYKNEELFENEWATGTPDVILDDKIVDIKSSWDIFTFPYFDKELKNTGYWWQLQVYMWLTGKRKAEIAYCLVNTPENLIYKEFMNEYYAASNYVDISEEQKGEIENEVRRKLTYYDIPNDEKIKIFSVEYDPEAIERLKARVEECNKFLSKI